MESKILASVSLPLQLLLSVGLNNSLYILLVSFFSPSRGGKCKIYCTFSCVWLSQQV